MDRRFEVRDILEKIKPSLWEQINFKDMQQKRLTLVVNVITNIFE